MASLPMVRVCLIAATLWAPRLGFAAGSTPASVPTSQIPPPVVAQLRSLENQFDLALAQDCAPERCFSKGCVYVEHAVVDQPRSASLPGLGTTEGPGSVPAQEYLTQARCEFTHEKSVSPKDVQALLKRLEQKLSKGWLVVSVLHQTLEPVSQSLREPPPQREPVVPPALAPAAPVPAPAPKWDLATAMRELWVSLLPHFSWMIALFLVTLASLTLIWALRRLGRESLEEKALLAQLANGGVPPGDKETDGKGSEAPDLPPPALVEKLPEGDSEKVFVEEQMQLWNERIASAQMAKGESVIVDLLREWLRAGEFALLAKAVFIFSNRMSLAFPADGDLAMRKIEFAEYLRTVDEDRLPTDAEFLRKLSHHAISSAVLAQSDADVYRSLREEFGSSGIAGLIETLPARQGALLFALVPADYQQEVARVLSPKLRHQVSEQLLLSNRIAKDEISRLFDVLRAARAGAPLPPELEPEGVIDRGREFDASGALSSLLPHVDANARSALFSAAFKRSNGAFPLWYEQILFADMILKIPEELQADVLLDVDIRALAGWFSVQPPLWQDAFIRRLTPSMQNAIRASMAFASRADQLVLARRGRGELAAALQRLVARGKISFADVVVSKVAV